MRHILLATILAVFALHGCGRREEKEKLDPDAGVKATYASAQDRLVSKFLDEDGWIVSRKADGSPEHQGDSLLWGGISLWALDCGHGARVEQSFLQAIAASRGQLYRHPSLKGRVSIDGALGLYLGLTSRLMRCPSSALAEGIRQHLEYVTGSGGKLNDESDAKLVKEFSFVLDLLAHKAGLRGAPSTDRQATLEAQISAWATGVKAAKAACYRVHMGWVALRSIEELGGTVSSLGKTSYCLATDGLGLPEVDHWCGRDGLLPWLSAFEFNRYEYALQRCPGWEGPDGNGLETPGLDLLVGLRTAYRL